MPRTSTTCSKPKLTREQQKRLAEHAKQFSQIYFDLPQVREQPPTITKTLFQCEADTGIGIYMRLYEEAIDKEEATGQAETRLRAFLKLDKDQHIAWNVRKK